MFVYSVNYLRKGYLFKTYLVGGGFYFIFCNVLLPTVTLETFLLMLYFGVGLVLLPFGKCLIDDFSIGKSFLREQKTFVHLDEFCSNAFPWSLV